MGRGEGERMDRELSAYIAGVIEDHAQIARGFVEFRSKPFVPKLIHKLFGGGYYEVGKGSKRRGRVRLYGIKAKEFLEALEPHFRGSAGVRVRVLLKTWGNHP